MSEHDTRKLRLFLDAVSQVKAIADNMAECGSVTLEYIGATAAGQLREIALDIERELALGEPV